MLIPRVVALLRHLTVGLPTLWLGTGVPAGILLAISAFVCSPEHRWVWLGLYLQLGGLLLVARGIAETRRRFKRPSMIDRVATWLDQAAALLGPGQAIRVAGSISLSGSARGSTTVTGTLSTGTPTVEVRLQQLERGLAALSTSLAQHRDETRAAIEVERKALQDETADRRRDIEGVRGLLEEEAAGGLHFEAIGLIWLAIATVATTIPERLPSLVGWVACTS